MSCDNCKVEKFEVDGVTQTPTPVVIDGTTVAQNYSGPATNGSNPTWKTKNDDGTTNRVFGLMAWEAFAWDGSCEEDDEGNCQQIDGCGGWATLKFMLMVPKGEAPNITLTDPQGNPIPGGTPKPLPGSATNDVYRIDFDIDLDADCGTTGSVTLDDNWTVTLGGEGATHHTASGDIDFKLTCAGCEDEDLPGCC